MNNLPETETETLHACKFCSKKYKLLTRLDSHEKLCLSARSREEKSCRTCGQTFKRPKSLQKHELMHTLDHKFACRFCSLHFATKYELNVHKVDEHSDKVQRRRCKLCPNSILYTKEEYFVHVNEEHQGQCSDYHMCSDCGKQFKTKSELNNHNKSLCGTVKQFKCEVCDQKLMTAGSLYNHMLRHTVTCTNMCGYCGKMFLTIGQLRVHERTHTQEKAFVCSVCGKGFCHRQSLITHSSLHTGIKPYQCDNCGRSFSCVGNLIKHRRTHADTCGSVPLTSHRVTNPTTKLKVKINTPTTSKISAIKKEREMNEKLAVYKNKIHQRTEPEVEAIPPEVEQLGSDQFVESIKEETPPPEVPKKRRKKRIAAEPGKGLQYACQDCDRRFAAVRQLVRHEKSHGRSSKNSIHKCRCCKDSFESREECKEHQQSEHADLLSCQDCDKIFSNVDSLRSHVRIFHKGLPKKVYVYICDKCGVQFRQKMLLHHHEQNNCERTPMYGCEICGKRFHSLHARKSHLRIHDPKKKFLCKFCGKNFRWKGQLKVHERSHTGEKPFKCLYCPKAFGYRESLITHSSLHTGVKPHLCEACGSRFSCVGNLIKHRATHASTCGVWYAKNK